VIIICDNSALSGLAEIGELDLLRRLYGKIHVTGTVLQEAIHAGAPVSLRSLFLSQPDWISVVLDDSPFWKKRVRWMQVKHPRSPWHGITEVPVC